MNCRNKILSIFAATALIAAAAVPALALENEFHGAFTALLINSNFNGNQTAADFYEPAGKPKNQYSANFLQQRARLQYLAKVNADLKLVTTFELDYTFWGNSSYTVGRNQGGALGADTVNIETKSIYVDANPFKGTNIKLGMMPNNDAFKSVLFDADMAGVLLSGNYGKFSPAIGYFRFNDKGLGIDKVLGHKTNDLFMLDGKFEISKELKLGAAYYFFRDNQANASTIAATGTQIGVLPDGTPIFAAAGFTPQKTVFTDNDVKIHALGLNAAYGHGPLSLSGFAIYETGWNSKRYTSAFAGNVGARLKTGPGAARAEFLYVTGDGGGNGRSNAFFAVDGEHGYYDNEMVILGRDKNAMTTDNSIIFNTGNKGQGQIGAYFGYDLPVTDRLSTAFNVGFAGITHKNGNTPNNVATGKPNASNFLGSEINAEVTCRLMDNLKTSFRAGYVFLGDYYDNVALNGTPVNPYDAKIVFKLTF